ncbi:GH92 family glycosyl hydrolase [Danxiaibacter flavus]|uniref:GH92 family glycosyl hydrolase n=1 Tax=Danxiaibacter flavus TaxID=3049108 RepID=A0ABV3ZEC2_9BACT|nr:GH92 family glycosyl hydrolase [Chitinophagaceae bacterium DXS]
MKKISCLYLFGLLLQSSLFSQSPTQTFTGADNLKYIDPTIGNIGQLLEPTRPTVQIPNQVIRMYPMRKDYLDDQISSFPLTIVSHRLGEVFSIKPSIGVPFVDQWRQRMPYDHNLEITRPWYYSTYLLNDEITVEFTPGKKTGFYRFSFPKNTPGNLLFTNYNNGESTWKFIAGNEIEGVETYHDDIKVYVYGVFNSKGTTGIVDNGQLKNGTDVSGKFAKAYISFPAGINAVELKYAISFVSAEQARKNFDREIKGKDFSAVKKNAEKAWASIASQIQVEGGTEAQKRSFYTALYRTHERMVDISEDSFYYSGYNKQINKDPRPFYVDDWSWDTYLALHPLRMILHPAQEEDMLQSYVRMYKQSGWMPTFPVLFGDHACMNGFHSSVIFLDAYRKGLKNYDIQTAFEGIKKNATDATLLPWRNGPKTILDDYYHTNGYYPALAPGVKDTVAEVHPFESRQAVAVTLGASYDDWAAAQLAKELGKNDDYVQFSKRGFNYKTLWNNDRKFFLPKDDKGEWINIDPKFDGGPGGRDYYDENNGWTYMWQVQEDIPGLINLMGGAKSFEARLDQLFREDLGRSKHDFWYKFPDATGLVGQYSMGNEPSFHIPYLYNYAGAPWKTQNAVRQLLDLWFKDNVFGIPGDEDGGGMTAFVVFSSMGFYPVTPGIPVYTIGSPVFSKVTIRLDNGKQFKLIANNCSVVNKYIQRATMNGKELTTPWFTHEQLINGGTLVLEMGPKPNKQWGATTNASTITAALNNK